MNRLRRGIRATLLVCNPAPPDWQSIVAQPPSLFPDRQARRSCASAQQVAHCVRERQTGAAHVEANQIAAAARLEATPTTAGVAQLDAKARVVIFMKGTTPRRPAASVWRRQLLDLCRVVRRGIGQPIAPIFRKAA